MPYGGTLTVTGHWPPDSKYLTVAVEDNGVGIPEDREYIFDMFLLPEKEEPVGASIGAKKNL